MELEGLYNKKRLLEAGMKEAWYKEVTSFLQAQITARRQGEFSLEMRSLDDAFAVCKMKAEIAGLQFALAVPQIMLNDIEADIQSELAVQREKESING